MRGIRHPLTGAVYDLQEDGTILVEKDGRSGVFTHEGAWMGGDLRQADAHLCGWIGGRQVQAAYRGSPKYAPATESTTN